LLIGAGANVNAQNGWLRSPLHYAAEHGRRNVVHYLIKQGAEVNLIDWHKHTPLHFATMRGHRSVVKCLLEAGADPQARTLNMLTPLHLAAKRGRDDVALMLLDYGADPNARAKQTTPLHEAAKECNSSIVKILIDWGADLECKDSNRKTPMSVAVLNRDKLTETLLVGAGAEAPHLQALTPAEDFWPDLSHSESSVDSAIVSSPSTEKKSLKQMGSKVLQLR
jgi:ankyrin repeat protein